MVEEKKKHEEVEPKPVVVVKPVEERFRDIISELIFNVVEGTKLSEAKHTLHAFIDELSVADRDSLYLKATAISTRIRDVAISLTSETPALLSKMQP